MDNPLRLNTWRTSLLTAFALIAFASNSVLNRLALGGNTIDAGSYIGIRLVSGALTLWLINGISKRDFSLIRTAFECVKSPITDYFTFNCPARTKSSQNQPTNLPLKNGLARAAVSDCVCLFCGLMTTKNN